MPNNVQLFSFKDQEIRVIFIDNKPYWILADVCKPLDIGDPSRVADRLDPDGTTFSRVIDSLGREQKVLCINEPNLYRTIFRSNKPEAIVFQDWIFEEVLPAIRQTGYYSISGDINFEGYDEISHLDLQDDPELLRQAIQFYEDLNLAGSDKRKMLKEIEKEKYPENAFTRGKRKPMKIKFYKKQVGDKVQFGIAILGKERVIQRAMWGADRTL
jgi:prophage antirepressor-like protein